MKKLSEIIVKYYVRILAAAVILCGVCAFLMTRVHINADMTRYLPDSSPMKQGVDLMAEEFSSLQMPKTIRVMQRIETAEAAGGYAPADEAVELESRLKGLENISSADRTDETVRDGVTYVLYTVSTEYDYQTEEELGIEADILALRSEGFDIEVVNDNTTGMPIPALAYAVAITLLLIVLFAMCASWVEPFLFLAAIGIAIVLNLGTNILLGTISKTTYSMTAILQLVLSMDYSVILMNRYRQEKAARRNRSAYTGTGLRAEPKTGALPGNGMSWRSESSGQALGQASGQATGQTTGQASGQTTGQATGQASGQTTDQTTGQASGSRAAMASALQSAFPSIASSGMTTFVGLIMLVFMRFKIGKDLGLVLAKGVLLSMICVLTVLPGLILLFDKAVERTAKKVLYIPTGALSRFSYRFRKQLTAGFILLFIAAFFLQSRSGTAYSLSAEDPIAAIFPPSNMMVLLYDNADEAAAAELAADLEAEEESCQVLSYGYVMDRQMGPDEMAGYLKSLAGGSFSSYLGADAEGLEAQIQGLTGDTLRAVYALNALQSGGGSADAMSVSELFAFISRNLYNPLVSAWIDPQMREQISSMEGMLSSAKDMLVGPEHSLMIVNTTLPVESEETEAFIRGMKDQLEQEAQGSWYLIGNSPMSVEMKDSFRGELTLITGLTAAAIFVVVALTFRQLLIPLLLVGLVQCGVYMTISTVWLLGYRMYFLAIIIVQCILMGATVDYAILMTSYYREIRKSAEKQAALTQTYEKSIHTVLTSAMFMIFVTGALGFSPVDPTIGQICQSIALGALSATLLVVFVLPGMLSALDRWTAGQGAARNGPAE